MRSGREQHDLQRRVEQVEDRLHLFDDPVLTAGVEERTPVLAGRLEIVLAPGGIGEHAVDVDDDRRARLELFGAPGPVFGQILQSSVGAVAR